MIERRAEGEGGGDAMGCSEIRAQMREWSMGARMPAEAAQHLDGCPACSKVWEEERQLTAEFAALRGESRAAAAAPQVAAALDAAFAQQRRGKGGTEFSLRPVLALAAALLLTVAGLIWMRSSRPSGPTSTVSQTPDREVYTNFFPLSAAASRFDMSEASHVIRIRLPRGEMRRFGVPVQEGFERLSVEADVVIGQDGIARAVRFVQ